VLNNTCKNEKRADYDHFNEEEICIHILSKSLSLILESNGNETFLFRRCFLWRFLTDIDFLGW